VLHYKCKTRLGFEALAAVIMKDTIFSDITPCSPLKVHRPFVAVYHLYLQGRRISQARYKRCYPLGVGLFVGTEVGGRYVHPKSLLILNELHCSLYASYKRLIMFLADIDFLLYAPISGIVNEILINSWLIILLYCNVYHILNSDIFYHFTRNYSRK
jgi:hypothetical protein